jgi:hypothetical protein
MSACVRVTSCQFALVLAMCWGYGMDGYCIRVSRVYRLPPVFFRGAGTHTTIDTTKHTINTLTHDTRFTRAALTNPPGT